MYQRYFLVPKYIYENEEPPMDHSTWLQIPVGSEEPEKKSTKVISFLSPLPSPSTVSDGKPIP